MVVVVQQHYWHSHSPDGLLQSFALSLLTVEPVGYVGLVYNTRFRVRDRAVPGPAISVIVFPTFLPPLLWYVNVNVLEPPWAHFNSTGVACFTGTTMPCFVVPLAVLSSVHITVLNCWPFAILWMKCVWPQQVFPSRLVREKLRCLNFLLLQCHGCGGWHCKKNNFIR